MTPQAQHIAAVAEEMLLDAGLAQELELRRTLLSLGAFADLPVPEPGPALGVLLAPPADQLERRRKLRRHRAAVVGVAVVAGMGLGATGVAASSVPHEGAGSLSVQHLLEDWKPSWSIAPPPSAGAADSAPPSSGPSPEPVAAEGDGAVPEPDANTGDGEFPAPDGGAAAGTVPASGGARHQEKRGTEGPWKAHAQEAQEASGRNGGGGAEGSPGAGQTPGSAAESGEAARNSTKNGAAPGGGPVLPWLKKTNR